MNNLNEKLLSIKEMLYGKKSDVPLSNTELISVCLTYPAALVAAADNNVDETERLYLLSISEGLDDSEKDIGDNPLKRLAASERYRAFMWLLNQKELVDEIILGGIRELIKVNPQTGDQIKEMLWSMAGASEGISEEERKEISRICSTLEIAETVN